MKTHDYSPEVEHGFRLACGKLLLEISSSYLDKAKDYDAEKDFDKAHKQREKAQTLIEVVSLLRR